MGASGLQVQGGGPLARVQTLLFGVSRRLRLAALTVIALFAVKIAVAAFAPPPPAASAPAGAPIAVSTAIDAETLEQME